jgi:hypothetical protein
LGVTQKSRLLPSTVAHRTKARNGLATKVLVQDRGPNGRFCLLLLPPHRIARVVQRPPFLEAQAPAALERPRILEGRNFVRKEAPKNRRCEVPRVGLDAARWKRTRVRARAQMRKERGDCEDP